MYNYVCGKRLNAICLQYSPWGLSGVAYWVLHSHLASMDTVLVASSTNAFIDGVQTILGSNLSYVLAFAAGILVWNVLKKWIFGGTRRV